MMDRLPYSRTFDEYHRKGIWAIGGGDMLRTNPIPRARIEEEMRQTKRTNEVQHEMTARGLKVSESGIKKLIKNRMLSRPKITGTSFEWTREEIENLAHYLEANMQFTSEGWAAFEHGYRLASFDDALINAGIEPGNNRYHVKLMGIRHGLMNLFRRVEIIPFSEEENAEADRVFTEGKELWERHTEEMRRNREAWEREEKQRMIDQLKREMGMEGNAND